MAEDALFSDPSSDDDGPWLSVSDLMSGLMLVFLAIAVFFMRQVNEDRQAILDVAEAYGEVRDDIYTALDEEFKPDLEKWGAEISREDLSIRFTPPWILFPDGKPDFTRRFRDVLDDFFPRYVGVLTRPEFRDRVVEVRIEGHTSSRWNEEITGDEAYLKNMELSQARTRKVLEYVMNLDGVDEHWERFLRARLTANGLSSSKLKRDERGREDERLSRRVEFRVVTDADAAIQGILERQQVERK